MEVFRQGKDIYSDMATGIYGYEVNKDDHPEERQFGKQAILGLGFSMGFLKFLLTCRRYNIHFSVQDVLKIMGREQYEKYTSWVKNKLRLEATVIMDKTLERWAKAEAARYVHILKEAREDPRKVVHELALMKYTVDVYRSRYPEVPQLWKEFEEAAISVVQDPWVDGKPWAREVKCSEGKIKYKVEGDFLHCVLPSGRPIPYYDPKVSMTKTSWGEIRPHLSYMSVDSFTKKWSKTGTYGGKLVENAVQATSREITAKAVENCWEKRDVYLPVMTVHDELVSEAEIGAGNVKEFEALMAENMPWITGCPVEAEAKKHERYRKG